MVVGVISLGCDKNRVDTENIMTGLSRHGYVFSGDIERCDVLLVNTCAFLESAREEAIDTILDVARYKQSQCKALVVAGCLPMLFKDELVAELPEVDIWLTPEHYDELGAMLDARFSCVNQNRNVPSRLLTTPEHYAYLKIADGCNNFCTYCMIPYIRGRFVSRPPQDILQEAKALVHGGVKELILVAQDTTRYGMDNPSFGTLADLVKELDRMEGLEVIRLLYCYPEKVSDDLIACFAECKKLAPYLDMPLQHISNSVLKRMNRRSTKESVRQTIDKLRTACPNISIRSTFMVGFPGETQDEFDELCEFLKEGKLDNVGFFAYSREEGTKSYDYEGQVDEQVKQERLAIVTDIQSRIALQKAQAKVGQVVKARYESIDYDRNLFVARSLDCAPDIDYKIYFTADFADVGMEYNLLITDVDGCDLIAQMVD